MVLVNAAPTIWIRCVGPQYDDPPATAGTWMWARKLLAQGLQMRCAHWAPKARIRFDARLEARYRGVDEAYLNEDDCIWFVIRNWREAKTWEIYK